MFTLCSHEEKVGLTMKGGYKAVLAVIINLCLFFICIY